MGFVQHDLVIVAVIMKGQKNMNIKMYAIKDIKSESFGGIFTDVSDGPAVRQLFSSIDQNPKSQLAMFPDDYVLYNIGDFDTDTGHINSNVSKLYDISRIIEMYRG